MTKNNIINYKFAVNGILETAKDVLVVFWHLVIAGIRFQRALRHIETLFYIYKTNDLFT